MKKHSLQPWMVFLLLLLSGGNAISQTIPSQNARWSGNLELVSGFGAFLQRETNDQDGDTLLHFREQLIVQLTRTAPKLTVSTRVQGLFESNETRTQRTTVRNEKQVELSGRGSKMLQPGTNLRTDFTWRPSPRHQYSAFLTYQYGYDNYDNMSANSTLDTSLNFSIDAAREVRKIHQHGATAGWRSNRELGSARRQIVTSGVWRGTFRLQESQWSKGRFFVDSTLEGGSDFLGYRLTPRTFTNDGTVTISFRDSLLNDTHRLLLEPGFRTHLVETREYNSGASSDDMITWRDSTRLREDFDFVTVQFEPQLRLEYRYKSLLVSADYYLQFYGRQLTSQLHSQAPEWLPVLVNGRSFVEWMPEANHRLTLGNTLSVSRPSYIQTCWYDRQGADPTQLYQGNPYLLPTRTISTDLGWRLRLGRFRLTTGTTYAFRLNEVEQYFLEQEIDGNDYKVFSWINTAYGHTFIQNVQLGWNGQVLSSNLQVNYEQRKRTALLAQTESKSNTWTLMADISVRLGKGWTFSADGSYIGDIENLYSLTKKHFTVNSRIAKEFKNFSLYLEGRDLLDMPIVTEYFTQDLSVRWIEVSRLNRRIFLLGLTWKF